MKRSLLLLLATGILTVFAQGQAGKALRSLPAIDRPIPNFETTVAPNPPPAESRGELQEDFEGFNDFELDLSPWMNIDEDGAETYGIEGYTFPGMYDSMAFIVFNPGMVTPSMTNDPAIQPHSGDKFAACFSSIPPPYNDDWLISPQVTLGTNSELNLWVKSYTDEWGLERYNIGISTTDGSPGSFTIISGPSPLLAPATAWQEKTFDISDYDGQAVYIGIQCVSQDAFIFMVDDVEIRWDDAATGATLSGMVTDATNDEPIEGAVVTVAGLSDVTDAAGNYLIENVPAGELKANFGGTPVTGYKPLTVEFSDLSTENSHTVSCTADGYSPYENQQVVIPEGGNVTFNIPMSPEIAAGQMRMVLSWGAFPEDLDAHLLTPEIGGQSYEVYYDNMGSLTEAPFAFLDNDDVDGFGPETITVADFFNGTYKYFIFNYDENASVSVSNAVVRIYDDAGLKHELNVPSTGDGFYWYVCDIDGATQQVTIRNQIMDSPPGNARSTSALPKIKPPKTETGRDLVSWSWDFGDGGTSNDQNPAHTYQEAGTYSVSLTVSDGTNQDTETKPDFVIVGSLGIDDPGTTMATVYPNPSTGYLKIHSDKVINILVLTDLNGKILLRRDVSEKSYTLETGGLAPGVYLLRFEGQPEYGIHKILVR